MSRSPFENLIRGFTVDQMKPHLRKLYEAGGGDNGGGAEVFKALDANALQIILQDAEMVLVDRHGRVIPYKEKVNPVDAERRFHFGENPMVILDALLLRLQHFFPDYQFLPVEEFGRLYRQIGEDIIANKQTSNLLCGSFLPLCFPQYELHDYGLALDQVFVPAVKAAYEGMFPGMKFHDCNGTLANKVEVVDRTKHQVLISRMAQGSVPAMYFPTAFQGWTRTDAQRAIRRFPNNYLLTGAIESSLALVAYPEYMASDFLTPGLDASALQLGDDGMSLFYKAEKAGLFFHHRDNSRFGFYAGGMLVVGK